MYPKKRTSDLEFRVRAVLRNAKTVMSVDDIAAELGVGRDEVSRAIDALSADGVIVEVGTKYGEG